jgi:hypothetical protein
MQQVPPSAQRGPGRNQPINVRVEVTITEQRGKAAPNRKLLTIIAADGFRNAIRSQETFFDGGRQMEVPLNVDLTPVILLGQRAEITGKIRVLLNLEYDLPGNELKKSATGEFERTLASPRSAKTSS